VTSLWTKYLQNRKLSETVPYSPAKNLLLCAYITAFWVLLRISRCSVPRIRIFGWIHEVWRKFNTNLNFVFMFVLMLIADATFETKCSVTYGINLDTYLRNIHLRCKFHSLYNLCQGWAPDSTLRRSHSHSSPQCFQRSDLECVCCWISQEYKNWLSFERMLEWISIL
jgi:hypothetical protein